MFHFDHMKSKHFITLSALGICSLALAITPAFTFSSSTTTSINVIISQEQNDIEQNEDATLSQLMTQLPSMFPSNNGNWSVYVANLTKESGDSINSHSMQAASLIKLYIMGAVYENYDALSQTYGSASLNAQLSPMITVSDNDAANTLVTWLGAGDSSAGMTIVNEYCKAHGYDDTHMGRLLLHPNDLDDNYTSVEDCGKFLSSIWKGIKDQEALAHASEMFDLLEQQQRTHKIPAGIPNSASTANKTGELADVENDAAIIFNTVSGDDLIICFMSDSLTAPGSAQNSIADMAGFIYKSYNP